MKISIRDGSKDGLFYGGLKIKKLEESPHPFWVCDVTEEQWAEWLSFLEEFWAWESFWDSQCSKENRTR